MVAHEIDGFAAIACLALHAQVHMFRQKLPQAGANNRMVIHNADLDHDPLSGGGHATPGSLLLQTGAPSCAKKAKAYQFPTLSEYSA